MVRRELNNKGFTFIELVISVAIIAIIMVSISTFMGSTTAVYTRTTKDNEVQIHAQDVYNTISTSIMQANKVVMLLYVNPAAGDTGAYTIYMTDDVPGVVGYKSGTTSDGVSYGTLLNENRKAASFTHVFYTKTETTSGRVGRCKALKSLKTIDSTTGDAVYSEYSVKALFIEYQTVDASGNYKTAYVTYNAGNDGKLYMNKHLAGETTSDGKLFDDRIDLSEKEENLLTDKLDFKTVHDYGFTVTVDADANSIGLNLNFKNAAMSYKTLGMTKIRNTSVLTRKQ